MLRQTVLNLKTAGLKSHQITGAGYAYSKNRFAYNYGQAQMKYGNGGFGMSTYSVRKKHNPKPRPMRDVGPLSTVLSGHFRSYALADGGVLVTHPSHKQLMQWSHDVEEREAAAAGITAVSENNKAKIQSIMVDNTLENYALSAWRRKHLWTLVRAKNGYVTEDGNRHWRHSLYQTVRSAAILRRISSNSNSVAY